MKLIINQLIDNIDKYIDEENKINEVDEMCENLFILITKGHPFLSNLEQWDYIIDVIERYTLLKSKNHKSLSNKTIFKFMDLQEYIEDLDSDESDNE